MVHRRPPAGRAECPCGGDVVGGAQRAGEAPHEAEVGWCARDRECRQRLQRPPTEAGDDEEHQQESGEGQQGVEEPDEDGVYTFEPELTNPGGQRAAISNISVCGSETDDKVDPECAALSVSYECTTYNEERAGGVIENWRRTGTRFWVTNTGGTPAGYGEAVSNDVKTFDPVGSQTVAADDTRTFVSDSSVPQRVIVFWEGSPECADRLDLETWGEFKDRRGFADLDAFYDGTSPADSPTDLDDSLYVAEAEGLPEGSEPDMNISPAQYPDLSDEAEAAGWITCAKRI